MKILFVTRSTLFTVRGGDTVQIIETAAHLRELGVAVDIKNSAEISEYSGYDLIHFFNIIRPADIIPHIRKSKLPFVVSTIFVEYSEFDKQFRQGVSGFLFKLLHSDAVEYLKNIIRSLLTGNEKIPLQYIIYGHKKTLKEIASKASLLLPNSESEYNRLKLQYGIHAPYMVIPNGIRPDLFTGNVSPFEKDESLVLCAARIEGVKNQLHLIKALNNTKFKLLLIGNPAPNQMSYYNHCRKVAAGNIKFIQQLHQDELLAYYKKAKVHVLPSLFETTGLSSLEAAVMGCNVVISNRGDVKEYFKDFAFYCDPVSTQSILQAIENAAAAPVNPLLTAHIQSNFTWQKAAEQTLIAYKKVLAAKNFQ
ncbi:MAG: glycosyltransferase family 4 protein [Chitinophagaceae bacterium]